MSKYRTMLTINGRINGHSSEAPRSTWRYAICRLAQVGMKRPVADEIVEGGFTTRQAAEVRRLELERS